MPDELESIDSETARELGVMMASYTYSGPLPHPDIIRMYEEMAPGTANRIIVQFEAQSEHRRAIEARESKAEVFKLVFGQLSASLLGVLGMSGGIYLVLQGRSISGFSTFFAALASLLGVFVAGKFFNDRAERRQAELSEERPTSARAPASKPKSKPHARKR